MIMKLSIPFLPRDYFPSMPNLANAYAYSDQYPVSFITNMMVTNNAFSEGPFYFSIFKTVEVQKQVLGNSKIYEEALAFLSSPQTAPDVGSSSCTPNIDGQASEFCVYTKFGSIHTVSWFIPSWYTGKSYNVGLLVRDHSSVPVLRRTNLTISIVPKCFPLTEMYAAVKNNCPQEFKQLVFPANTTWSSSTYGSKLPIDVTSSPVLLITRMFLDVDLLANFHSSLSSVSVYDIKLELKDRSHIYSFSYSWIPSTTVLSGNKVNITLSPSLKLASTDTIVNVSLNLVLEEKVVVFNSPYAVSLQGYKQIAICPSSVCLDAYRPWKATVDKLRNTSRSSCIEDYNLQEQYLKPCANGE